MERNRRERDEDVAVVNNEESSPVNQPHWKIQYTGSSWESET